MTLPSDELLLYLLLIIVGDRQGVSYYGEAKLCQLLKCSPEVYQKARKGLIDKDLIAFDGVFFQVLSLPARPKQIQKVASQRNAMAAREGLRSMRAILEQMHR